MDGEKEGKKGGGHLETQTTFKDTASVTRKQERGNSRDDS